MNIIQNKERKMFEKNLHLKSRMDKTILIQRLMRYQGHVVGPFSFGGGLRNGGLTQEALSLLEGIFTFDYMGAAEFEFGAVPNALSFLWDEAMKGEVISGSHNDVFYICPRTYENGVKDVIDQLLADEDDMELEEYCGLKSTVNSTSKQPRLAGWLELDNGFFFFVDQDMFEKVKNLFKV
jgi:hypothetical protein